jgi:hypothetical protein
MPAERLTVCDICSMYIVMCGYMPASALMYPFYRFSIYPMKDKYQYYHLHEQNTDKYVRFFGQLITSPLVILAVPVGLVGLVAGVVTLPVALCVFGCRVSCKCTFL